MKIPNRIFFLGLTLPLFCPLNSYSKNADSIKKCDFHLISLGPSCQVASMKNILNFSSEYFPFDWMFTFNFDSICRLIKNKFANFLDKSNLELHAIVENKMQLYKNKLYDGVFFLHDFSVEYPIEQYYDEVYAKYKRRIDRFYQACTSDKKVFFFRHGVTFTEAEKFSKLMLDIFPKLDFTFVVLNDLPFVDFKLPHVRNFYVKNRVHTLWGTPESIQEWTAVYQELDLLFRSPIIIDSISDNI